MPNIRVTPYPPFKRGGTAITPRTAGDTLNMGNALIKNVANPVDEGDAVNLRTLQESINIGLNYWLGNATLVQSLTDSETALTETPTTDPQTLSTITFKSAAAATPTPFTIEAGEIVEIHFNANVTTASGKHPTVLRCQLGYVDADGTSNFTQIGSNSDDTATLTAVKTEYTLHSHVATGVTVPAGKRLWLKFIADATVGGGTYPEINVYYNAAINHITFGVQASILNNFLQLAGGTMTGKTVTAGSSEVGKTYTPATGAQTVALDCALNNIHHVSGHANGTAITFTVANAVNSQCFIVSILQGAVVSTIAAWFATIR